MTNKNYQNESKVIIASSDDRPVNDEKTNIQLRDAQSLLNEVQGNIDDESPTSIKQVDSLEGETRQFHSRIMPVVQEFPAQAQQYYPTPLPPAQELPVHPQPSFSLPHTNQIPNTPVQIPHERMRAIRPDIKFSRCDEPTDVRRPTPQANFSPAEQQAALNEILNKSQFNKKEFLIKSGMITVCVAILAVIVTAKLMPRQNNAATPNQNPDLTDSTAVAVKSAMTASEPVLSKSNNSPENAQAPEIENSAEAITNSSATPSASNIASTNAPTPNNWRPSQLPTKLDPTDPYAETPKAQPKPSTQKPTPTAGIIREVPF
jgi:hypothetical protein